MGSMLENMSSSRARLMAYCLSWYCSTAVLYATSDESASPRASESWPPSTDSASERASSSPCLSRSSTASSLRGSLPPPSTYSLIATLCITLGSAPAPARARAPHRSGADDATEGWAISLSPFTAEDAGGMLGCERGDSEWRQSTGERSGRPAASAAACLELEATAAPRQRGGGCREGNCARTRVGRGGRACARPERADHDLPAPQPCSWASAAGPQS
eukprot:2535285-Prymnesium_polylepis.2